MQSRAFGYLLALSEVGPRDAEFRAATAAVRSEVLRWVLVYGLKEKHRDLMAGIDAEGEPLTPVSEYTREHRESLMGPADPDAPPLLPSWGASRTMLLLEGAPTSDGRGVEFWWGYDSHTGVEWGQILDDHRQGVGEDHRVKRDVIGLSPAARARVRDQVIARWDAWKRAGLAPGWQPPRAPAPPIPPLVVTGKTDYTYATFGIGAKGPPGPGVQSTGMRSHYVEGHVFRNPPPPPRPRKPRGSPGST